MVRMLELTNLGYGTNCDGSGMVGPAVVFQDFINYSALLDLPLKGGDFTWSRSGDESVCSRLDRFLVSADWEELFFGHVSKEAAEANFGLLPYLSSDNEAIKG